MTFERREKPDLSLYAEHKARKHLVQFLLHLWNYAVRDQTHDLLGTGQTLYH